MTDFEREDMELETVMGGKFLDLTKENTEKPVEKAAAKPVAKKQSAPVKNVPAKEKPVKAPCEPVAERSFTQKLMECGKKAAVYTGLCLLIAYWQYTGQMEPSAAMPSMMVCTAMIGCTYGKVFAKEVF